MCLTPSLKIKLQYSANRIRKGYKVFSIKYNQKGVRSPFQYTEFYRMGIWLRAKEVKLSPRSIVKTQDVGFHICPTIKEAMHVLKKISHRNDSNRRLAIYKVHYKDIVSAGYWNKSRQINITATNMKILKKVYV